MLGIDVAGYFDLQAYESDCMAPSDRSSLFMENIVITVTMPCWALLKKLNFIITGFHIVIVFLPSSAFHICTDHRRDVYGIIFSDCALNTLFCQGYWRIDDDPFI